MNRSFGRLKILAAGKSSLAAIVCVGGRDALALLAAVGRLLREFGGAEAVERLQQQQYRKQTNPDVNASAHSAFKDTNSGVSKVKLFRAPS